MTPEQRLEGAVRFPEGAQALRSLVRDFFNEGRTKEEIYQLLENLVLRLRTQAASPESAEDTVLDVMDALTGWCHPDAQLVPEDDPAKKPRR